MPTRVQSRPAEMTRSSSERYHDYDPINANKNLQHKEALRLALGSILTPKRPFTPSSRSSSGTASPAHPASFAVPSSPQPPPPPQSTPVHDSHLHSRHIHQPHTPSRLGLIDSADSHWPSVLPLPPSPESVPSSSAHGSQQPSPSQETPPVLSLPAPVLSATPPAARDSPAIHAPSPLPAHVSAAAQPHSGSGTPKAKFLETLQSKSAWDALIHGSFS
ncbi:hypothetical protein BDZ94DRAFT_1270082 [Collybia nuda]|uniref:Uncharacterized protein n=1 Tax=Collybia nuda TaxID=64659 RepID=A0A9P5XXQ9_9AGAR|nr:hypothetical protein BDZ94DRAFT_1270082 [Collybia nuda]